MSKKIIIDANFPNETRVVLLDDNNQIEEIEYETANKQQNKGNIYLATINRIEPSLNAVFIEYGNEKKGFLPFIEIDPGYYDSNLDQKTQLSHLQPIKMTDLNNEELEQKMPSDIENLAELKDSIELDIEAYDNEIEPIEPTSETILLKTDKIEQNLKIGQNLLVQLVKEERGNKGAGFTTYISLAGKYCVLMPNKKEQNGISRKVSHLNERKRLKNIIAILLQYTNPVSASIIARTAAIGHSLQEIKKDYDYLASLWNKILSVAVNSSAPSFIHQEEGIIQKVIRDMFNRNISELLIQGSSAYKKAIKYASDISPNKITKINEYKNKTPIFTVYNIEEQLIKLYHPIVNLSSGGYIVINPTEALISIDVNSGRSTSEKTIEETAVKTNLEAAKELAKQLKLRDLSGLIVIDFIDMQDNKNKKYIEKSFKEFLSRDKARIQVGGISNFGLLEMSRQRMCQSFLEANTIMCNHCSGKGLVRAAESNAMLILRTIENEIIDSSKIDVVNIYANNDAVIYLLNNKREEINYIEEKYNIKLKFFIDSTSTSDSYSLEKIKSTKKQIKQLSPLVSSAIELPTPITVATENTRNTSNKSIRKKWKNNKKNIVVNTNAENTESNKKEENSIKNPQLSPILIAETGEMEIAENSILNVNNNTPLSSQKVDTQENTNTYKRHHIRKKNNKRRVKQ